MTPAGAQERRRPEAHGTHISALEWAIAAIGLLLVVGTIALTLREAVRGGDAHPAIVVHADSVIVLGASSYLVRFTAENRGERTASEVAVVGELRTAPDSTETSEVTLDYVPGGSRRRGGLFFRSDPRRGALQLRAAGFQDP